MKNTTFQASTAEDVQKGVKKIKEIVEMQIYNPDCEQAVALRAKHMYELAMLNGNYPTPFPMITFWK